MLSKTEYSSEKLSHKRLSKLMQWILLYTGDGIERGQIIQDLYGLERGYNGCWADLCLRGKEKIRYDNKYRKVQPVLSKCLNRMEKRNLVKLIRHGRYVKRIHLTTVGRRISEHMSENEKQKVESWAQEKRK